MVRADDRGQVRRQVATAKIAKCKCLSGDVGGQQRPLVSAKVPSKKRVVKLQRPLITNICVSFYLSAANQSPDHLYTFAAYHPFVAVIALTHVSTVVRLERGVLV